jgi:hypothetical protein
MNYLNPLSLVIKGEKKVKCINNVGGVTTDKRWNKMGR